MRPNSLFALFLVVIVQTSFLTCRAIFQEQKGEFDWKKENIGFLDQSISHNQAIFTSSSNVLASLNEVNGKINWRVVLPKSSKILRFVVTSNMIYAVSLDNRHALVSAWFSQTGQLFWELPISSSNNHDSNFDLLLGSGKDKDNLSVLYDNQIHILQGISSPNPTHWNHSPQLDNQKFVLSHMIKRENQQDLLVAGCVISGENKDTHCTRSFIFEVALPTREAKAPQMFGGIPVPANSIRTQPSGTVLYGLSTPSGGGGDEHGDHNLGVSVHYLSVSSSSSTLVRSIAIPAPSSFSSTSSSANLFFHPSFPSSPLLSMCSTLLTPPTDTTSTSISSSCSLYDFGKGQGIGKGDADQLASRLQLECSGQTAYLTSSPSTSITCISINKGGLGTSVSVQPASSSSFRLVGNHASIRYAASLATPSSLLIQTSSGYLPYFRSPNPSSSSSSSSSASLPILWSRDEAVSGIRQMLIVDDIDPILKHTNSKDGSCGTDGAKSGGQGVCVSSGGSGDSDAASMPDFYARLTLQREEIQGYLSDMVLSLAEIDSKVAISSASSYLGNLLPPPLAGMLGTSFASRPPTGPRTISKRQQSLALLRANRFGMLKIGVCLSVPPPVRSGLSPSSMPPSLIVMGIDLLSGKVIWTHESILFSSLSSSSSPSQSRSHDGTDRARSEIDFASIILTHPTKGAHAAQISLLASTISSSPSSSETLNGYSLTFDSSSGAMLLPSSSSSASSSSSSSSGGAVSRQLVIGMPQDELANKRILSVSSSPQPSSSPQFLLLCRDESKQPSTSTQEEAIIIKYPIQPDPSPSLPLSPSSSIFLHHLDKTQGIMNIYHIDPSPSSSSSSSSHSMSASLSSSLSFPPHEHIVSVAQPSGLPPHLSSSSSSTSSRATVLGDDSVLLNYLNPHAALITTVSNREREAADPSTPTSPTLTATQAAEAATTTASSSSSGDGQEPNTPTLPTPSSSSSSTSQMIVTLVDTVSGKIIFRSVHEGAAPPVHPLLIDNHILVAYWNDHAKRTEISVTSLFEGMVDKWGLSPISSFSSSGQRSLDQLSKHTNFTAFTSASPLAMQRTYVLPRPVLGIHRTLTRNGLSNKNALLALGGGQLYSLDFRQVHPRYPLTTPTQAEKDEGLMVYQPFVFLNPMAFVTLDDLAEGAVDFTGGGDGGGIGARSGVVIASDATGMESTTVVLSHWGMDLHFNRATPSNPFDLLASDFNYPLLILILAAMGGGVGLMRYYSQKKILDFNWA